MMPAIRFTCPLHGLERDVPGDQIADAAARFDQDHYCSIMCDTESGSHEIGRIYGSNPAPLVSLAGD